MYPAAKFMPSDAPLVFIQREPHKHGLAFDITFGDKTPFAAISTIITVIPHDKIVPWRDYHLYLRSVNISLILH